MDRTIHPITAGAGKNSRGGLGLDQLPALSTMSRSELADAWSHLTGTPAPVKSSREFLEYAVAYRLQELHHGGLKPAIRRKLESLGTTIDQGNPLRSLEPSMRLRPGTTLAKEWRGIIHSVTALEGGFLYDGRQYQSLSEIARAITGTRWNGPAFFGLRTAKRQIAEVSRHGR